MPGGIIGSGFALKVEQKNKREEFNRLVPASANLIQTWYRMKVISQIPFTNTPRLLALLKVFKLNHIDTQSIIQIDLNSKETKKKSPISNENLTATNAKYVIDPNKNEDICNEAEQLLKSSKGSVEPQSKVLHNIDPRAITILRLLLILKFFVAKRKFVIAHQPYNFKDVIEQYTKGNMDILVKIKELQRKLDQSFLIQKNTIPMKASAKPALSRSNENNATENDSLEETVKKVRNSIFVIENRIDRVENKLDTILQCLEKKFSTLN